MELLFERFLSEERGEMAGHRYRSSERCEAGTGHPVCLRALRPARRRNDGERDHVTGAAPLRGISARCSGTKRMSWRGSPGWYARLEWKDPTETPERNFREAGFDLKDPRVRKFLELYVAVQDLPRHLGQHSGGMVICQGRLDSVVPLEPATMPGRTVVQWDKDDCADMGILKIDLLGLGMMAVLEDTINLIDEHYGKKVDLRTSPANDPDVYAALAEGRHDRVVPGRKPSADGCAATGEAGEILRHRGAGGHHPARTDRRQDGKSISSPPSGYGAARLHAPVA